MSKHVLITRPIDDGQIMAREIQALGFKADCAAFLKIVHHDMEIPDLSHFDSLIFTSKNAVRAFCDNSTQRDIGVFTVGDQTAKEVRKNGFQDVRSADGDLNDLEALLQEQQGDKPYLYVRGEHVSRVINQDKMPVRVEEIIVYHTEFEQQISDSVENNLINGAYSEILFMSQRTAISFAAYVQAHPQVQAIQSGLKRTKALCLAQPMIESLSVLPWQKIEYAPRPTRKSLVSLLQN